MDDSLLTFATELQQDIIQTAELEGEEEMLGDVFVQRMIYDLTDAGEFDDGVACYHRSQGVEVSGYSLDEDDKILNLFVSIYTQKVPPQTVTRADVEGSFRRLMAFYEKVNKGFYKQLEEASPVFDMALAIAQASKDLSRLRLFVFTDGLTTVHHKADMEVGDLRVSFHVWDIRRLFRCVTSGQGKEPIEIDLSGKFGQTLPCVTAQSGQPGYQAYLAIVPGHVLSELYAEYGPRLLELNVRSFLQAKGKVNQGIRKTLIDEPERFLAYNNGISATASGVTVCSELSGLSSIAAVSDLQIVNGGQTTASIFQAARDKRTDLSKVFVQMKLTVIPASQMAVMVPLISRYANSQNKISEADFSANDPFHVRLEELSRTIWAPAVGGTQRQTKWFYERARGQYNDAASREWTPARKKQFKIANPPAQRFTKTDVAKYENTWEQLPHVVSLGAQKNFRVFALALSQKPVVPDPFYFQRLIAKAIIFKRAERIVTAQNFGGYRANIVTFAVALICNKTAQLIDLQKVWQAQNIGVGLAETIAGASHAVYSVITSPPGGRNVTEWCKRRECWEAVRKLEFSLPDELNSELLSGDTGPGYVSGPRGTTTFVSPEEESLVRNVAATAAGDWFAVSSWAKETNSLQPWQRSLAYSVGTRLGRGMNPTVKQARQAVRLMQEAERLGFSRAPEEAEQSNQYDHESAGVMQ